MCVFLMKVDFAMLSRARERGDPDQLHSLRGSNHKTGGPVVPRKYKQNSPLMEWRKEVEETTRTPLKTFSSHVRDAQEKIGPHDLSMLSRS